MYTERPIAIPSMTPGVMHLFKASSLASLSIIKALKAVTASAMPAAKMGYTQNGRLRSLAYIHSVGRTSVERSSDKEIISLVTPELSLFLLEYHMMKLVVVHPVRIILIQI